MNAEILIRLFAGSLIAILAIELFLKCLRKIFQVPHDLTSFHNLIHESSKALYQGDPHMLYKCRPGTYQINAQKITINSYGFRYSDDPCAKEKNEVRIFLIGGSTTFDLNVSDEESWPYLLSGYLQALFSETRIRVINGGVPGYTTAESLCSFALKGIDYNPDIVLIHHGYNDVNPRLVEGFQSDYAHYRTDYWRPPGHPFLVRYSDLYRFVHFYITQRFCSSLYMMTVRNFNPLKYYGTSDSDRRKVLIEQTNTNVFVRNLNTLIDVIQGIDAWPVIMNCPIREDVCEPAFLDGCKQANEAMADLAKTEKVKQIDLAKKFPLDPVLFSSPSDAMHLSKNGSNLKAKLICNDLAPIIKDFVEQKVFSLKPNQNQCST